MSLLLLFQGVSSDVTPVVTQPHPDRVLLKAWNDQRLVKTYSDQRLVKRWQDQRIVKDE